MVEYLSSTLQGMVLVCDTFHEPCQPFLSFLLCAPFSQSLLLLQLDYPFHTLSSWVPNTTTATTTTRVLDAYGMSWHDVGRIVEEECALRIHGSREGGAGGNVDVVLLVDGITRWVLEYGVQKVLARLFEWRQRFGRCVVFTIHTDCGVSSKDLELLRGSSNIVISASPTRVHILNKKAGGKVVQTHQQVLDWSKGLFAPVPQDEHMAASSVRSAATPASLTAPSPQIELDSEQRSAVNRDRVSLPFIKTAVKGKMMFGEEPKDSDDEEASEGEDDPDADLDV